MRSWTATQSAVDLLNAQSREDEVLVFLELGGLLLDRGAIEEARARVARLPKE